MPLHDFACVLQQASGAVAVDTGLGHLAAALSVPCISLYGPTNINKIGTLGEHQWQLPMHDHNVGDVLQLLITHC